jgi:hypothetical protein
MIARLFMTVGTLIGAMVMHSIWSPVATLIGGQAAGGQFLPSDAAALQTAYTLGGLRAIDGFLGLGTLFILFLLWIGPVVRFFKTLDDEQRNIGMSLITITILGSAVLYSPPANAFYQTTDRTEAYTVLPNWSAFWIPDTGNNRDDQAKMDSQDYLEKNKIAAKRFIIPHAKLSGSGGWSGWDAYVPSGRLILVDRTTYSHEWVDSHERGTSSKKEGFPCQTSEGINITTGVSVGARVDEVDAAKFLYNFGVQPPPAGAKNDDPNIIFQSVYYGRSLADVMQDVGRRKIQTLVCNEIGTRDFVSANKATVEIMQSVEKKAVEFFHGVGIQITFIGWADTFQFDEKVQAAVNSTYEVTIEAQNYAKLLPYVDVLKTFATNEALKKFNGSLPTTYVGQLPDWISPLVAGSISTGRPLTPPATVAPAQGK